MKLKVLHLDKDKIEKQLDSLKHVDFSLFIESFPESQEELSSINIVSLHEPNEYFGLHDVIIKNKNAFSAILTWNDKVLNNCENAMFLPFGHTWFKPDQYEKKHKKEFKIAHLRGNLLKSYGHQMRHEILDRKNELKIPTKFFDVYGDRHNIEDARIGKEEVFRDVQFGIAIENFSHKGFFTEKILDCFLLKTIPIYWGCSDIDEFFNSAGIISFKNVDDLIHLSNKLTPDYYDYCKEAIEDNYQRALQYVDYEQNITNKITEIFKLNNII
tara:strand:+ start:85 stop:897 length:813 start_codon:yes stop_codon:yes gene_type:complete